MQADFVYEISAGNVHLLACEAAFFVSDQRFILYMYLYTVFFKITNATGFQVLLKQRWLFFFVPYFIHLPCQPLLLLLFLLTIIVS